MVYCSLYNRHQPIQIYAVCNLLSNITGSGRSEDKHSISQDVEGMTKIPFTEIGKFCKSLYCQSRWCEHVSYKTLYLLFKGIPLNM